jgi:diamine N-acetyltransferase
MLKKEDITLRAPEPEDVDFLYGFENDTRLWHVSQTLLPYARFDLEQYIFSAKKEPFAAGQVRFVIEWQDEKNGNGIPIGTVDLFALDAVNRRAGVGIALLESYRGRSLAGKALDLVIEYAFNFLNLHQLFCNIEKDNRKSLRLFQSRNFVTAGLKKDWNKAGSIWKDEYLLQLIAKE